MSVWCLPLTSTFVRFSSHCPEGSPTSSSWFEINFDECNLKCWAFFFIFWWCPNHAYPCKLRILISASQLKFKWCYPNIAYYVVVFQQSYNVIHSLTLQWSAMFRFYGHDEFSLLIMIVQAFKSKTVYFSNSTT